MSNRPGDLAQKISSASEIHRQQGIDWVAAASKAGVGVQAAQITQAGAAPFTVDLTAEAIQSAGLRPMGNASYVVIVQGETAARATVDQSTITKDGFDVLGGADTEVLHILIVGTLENQRDRQDFVA